MTGNDRLFAMNIDNHKYSKNCQKFNNNNIRIENNNNELNRTTSSSPLKISFTQIDEAFFKRNKKRKSKQYWKVSRPYMPSF